VSIRYGTNAFREHFLHHRIEHIPKGGIMRAVLQFVWIIV
jgi:hypothetical protein